MAMTLLLHGLELRLLHAHMYVCEISKFVDDTHIIISNQLKVAEIIVHIAFLNFCRHVHLFPAKEIFFISHTHNKTKQK